MPMNERWTLFCCASFRSAVRVSASPRSTPFTVTVGSSISIARASRIVPGTADAMNCSIDAKPQAPSMPLVSAAVCGMWRR